MEQLISIIVPVYDVEAYLPRCVDSILNQTYKNLDVILVDDGSPDGSGGICDAYAAADPRVRVLHQENGGLSAARNAGLELARGQWLTFVDSDDWLEQPALERLAQALEENGADVACMGNWEVDEQTGEKTLGVCPSKTQCVTGEEMVGKMFTWDGCDCAACDKIFKKELFDGQRFPLGVVCEDVALTYQVVLKAKRAVLIDQPLYNYLQRTGSISRSALSDKSFHFSRHTQEIYAFIRKNHPAIAPQAAFIRVRSIEHILLLMELAGEEDRRRYAGAYRENRKALRKHLTFIFRYPRFSRRERLRDILLVMGAYRALRPYFTRDSVESV